MKCKFMAFYWMFLFHIVACRSSPLPDSGLNFIITNLMTNGANYSLMMETIINSKIIENLGANAPLTIFCVPNDVYKNTIVNDPTLIMGTQQSNSPTDVNTKKLLGRHIIKERLEPPDFKNDLVIPSFSGERLRLNKYGNMMTINGDVMTFEPQITTKNLAVYQLAGLIMPSMAQGLVGLLNLRRDRFSVLIQAVQMAGLNEFLEQGGPFTLFAPTNDAFKAIPEAVFTKLMASPGDLQKVLLGHVVPDCYFLAGLMNNQRLTAMNGETRRIAIVGNVVTVDGADVLIDNRSSVNMFADNGVLLMIDRVLMPSLFAQ